MHVSVCVSVHTCMHVFMCVLVNACVCACVHACVGACLCVCVSTHMCARACQQSFGMHSVAVITLVLFNLTHPDVPELPNHHLKFHPDHLNSV